MVLGATLLAGSTASLEGEPVPGVTESGDDPVEVVLLGVSHFAGSEGDDFSFAIEDVLEPHRQQELDVAAGRLAGFDPDAAYLECMPQYEGRFNERYQHYLAGRLDPVEEELRNEIYQLGFRMASEAGLEEVGCVDAEGLWLGDQARAVGAEHQPEIIEELERTGQEWVQESMEFLEDHDLVDFLRLENTDDELYRNHSQYIERFIRIGTFGDSELDVQLESDLEGKEVALVGDFSGFPVDRLEEILRGSGVAVVDELGPSTDYLVTGASPGDAGERAQEHGAQAMDIQEFVPYALEEADLYVGFPDGRIGADLVGEWYKRNLRTFANILEDIEPDTERVFVMIGSGHVWTLRQFFDDHRGFQVVPVDQVL